MHMIQTCSGKQNKFKAFTKQKKQDLEKDIGYAEKFLPYNYEIKLQQRCAQLQYNYKQNLKLKQKKITVCKQA